MTRRYFVYILASQRNGTLYIGVTNNLHRRIYEHKRDLVDGFTKKYGVHMLVHLEEYTDIKEAIEREKQLKNWHRQWKIALIEKQNSDWRDLSVENVEQLSSRTKMRDPEKKKIN